MSRRIQDLSREELENYCRYLKKKNTKLEKEISCLKSSSTQARNNNGSFQNEFNDFFQEFIKKSK